jgi:hypothetical protein
MRTTNVAIPKHFKCENNHCHWRSSCGRHYDRQLAIKPQFAWLSLKPNWMVDSGRCAHFFSKSKRQKAEVALMVIVNKIKFHSQKWMINSRESIKTYRQEAEAKLMTIVNKIKARVLTKKEVSTDE